VIQVEMGNSFIMMLAKGAESERQMVIASLNIENIINEEVDKVNEKISLALDLGESEVSGFSFDEEKLALFINF
jgi:hypothetical protein